MNLRSPLQVFSSHWTRSHLPIHLRPHYKHQECQTTFIACYGRSLWQISPRKPNTQNDIVFLPLSKFRNLTHMTTKCYFSLQYYVLRHETNNIPALSCLSMCCFICYIQKALETTLLHCIVHCLQASQKKKAAL